MMEYNREEAANESGWTCPERGSAMSRRKAVDWRLARRLTTLAILVALGLSAIACNFSFGMGEPKVEDITVCESLDADYKPVNPTTTFETDQQPSVSVQVSNLEEGSTVKARWLLQGSPVSEVSYTAEEGGSGYVGFLLAPGTSLKPGDYVVEIQLDGEPVGSGSFTVTGPPTPIAAPPTSTPVTPPTEAPPPPEKPSPADDMVDETMEMVTYSAWGLSIDAPSDWTAEEDDDTMSFGSPDGGLAAIVTYYELEAGEETTAEEDVAAAVAEGLAENYPDLEYVLSQPLQVGGVEGFEQDVAWTDEGIAMEGLIVVVIPEDELYTFVFLTPSNKYDAALPIFQAMVDSVEFEPIESVVEPPDEPSDEPAPPSGELCYAGEVTKQEEVGQTQIQVWGHVYDVNGDPVPGTVVMFTNEWGLEIPVRTDGNGGYSQDGITADIEWEMSLPELDSQPLTVKLEFGKRIFADWNEQPCP
jgi:hypothetical protein